MTMKSVEIYYDNATIPDIADRSEWSVEALEFRNDAMEHIESALMNENAGEWVGAEIGSGEVNFGFEVADFDVAERIIKNCVAGTPFDCIREIERREISAEEIEQAAAMQSDIKPMNFFEIIGMLVFRRMPRRFRDS